MSKIIGYDIGNPFTAFNIQDGRTINSTTLVSLVQINVPPNTYNQNDIVRLYSVFFKTGSTNGYDVRIYWNSTNSLNGNEKLIGGFSATTANQATYSMYRTLQITATTGSGTIGFTDTLNGGNSITNTTNPFQVYDINWTINSWFIFAGRVLSSSDNLGCRWARIANG
jgi:hypothetical protein